MKMARRLNPRDRVRAEGRRAAIREHARLGTDLTRPVDVFSVIERARVWLFFEPMPRLFGLYDRAGGQAPGILINSNHPIPLQRFTASHEYGHHVLGHEASSDDERTIHGIDDPHAEQEVAAQAFATEFLMPQSLVNQTMRRLAMPLDRDSLDEGHIYRIAIELGASYSATLTQLRTLKMLSPNGARRLREQLAKRRLIDLKADLLGDASPDELRSADVWTLTEGQSGQTLFPRVGDRVRIDLEERPSTGYRWALHIQGGSEAVLHLLSERFKPSDAGGYGADGTHTFTVAVEAEGQQTIHGVLSRPWEENGTGLREFSTNIISCGRPTGVADRGPSRLQREFLLAG